MKKKTWVLYYSVFGMFIRQEKNTSICELKKLENFLGIYETNLKAIEMARKVTNYRIKRLKYQLSILEK